MFCSKYDLYSKSKIRVDVEKVKPYYLSLIEKVTSTFGNFHFMSSCLQIEKVFIYLVLKCLNLLGAVLPCKTQVVKSSLEP